MLKAFKEGMKWAMGNKPETTRTNYKFKARYSLTERKDKAKSRIEKYKSKGLNCVPVVIENADGATIGEVLRCNYMADRELTMARLMWQIRKTIKLGEAESIYFMIANTHIPNSKDKIGVIYDKYKDEDGFLYISFAGENTFG